MELKPLNLRAMSSPVYLKAIGYWSSSVNRLQKVVNTL